jgi:DNA excision repair protein ERCC-3
MKSPEHLHTYRLSSLSLWNASSGAISGEEICSFLEGHSATGLPKDVRAWVHDTLSRTGKVVLARDGDQFVLRLAEDVREEVLGADSVAALVTTVGSRIVLKEGCRGLIKKALVRIGYPVEDIAGYEAGDALSFHILGKDAEGRPFRVREYQEAAARAFHAGGTEWGGAGVVVLPCGAGKTLVGIRSMELYQTQTLVLTTNRTAVAQWRRELLSRTSLREDEVGEYTGESKEIRPVTVSTYQILTYRRSQSEEFIHFDIFSRANWGLVVYDEVHLLPAPVFRVTAELQARRRLGLTATLVREDGKEDEVFSLIGPCRYELPWRDLERRGFIAAARCVEVRIPLDEALEDRYRDTDNRTRIRISAENPAKLEVLKDLILRHQGDRVLVIGQYLKQLQRISRMLDAPLITGKTTNQDREALYRDFRTGLVPVLVVSKVANFAIDLPDANVAIQVSGTFGSRQEEAQRLGRILRPKTDGGNAIFYTLVTEGTRDQEFSSHRQLFLAEQGYAYEIIKSQELQSGVSRS